MPNMEDANKIILALEPMVQRRGTQELNTTPSEILQELAETQPAVGDIIPLLEYLETQDYITMKRYFEDIYDICLTVAGSDYLKEII